MPRLVEINPGVLLISIFNVVIVFLLFRNYFPLEKGEALHLKPDYPSPKDALRLVWLKSGHWFLIRFLKNFVNEFLLFRNYLPLEKELVLHLNKPESPSPKNALCLVWLKSAHCFGG